MSFHWLYLVLFALCAIIPALVVLAVGLSQIMLIKGDTAKQLLEIDHKCKLLDDKTVQMDQLNKNCIDAANEANRASLRVENLDESLRQLSNKLAVRERDQRRAEEKRRKEEEAERQENYEEIPGTEQQQFFFPQQQPEQSTTVPKKRKFGTMP